MKYEELYSLTNIFLVSVSIFAAALGVGQTDALKTGISVSALLSSIIWLICSIDIKNTLTGNIPLRVNILVWMPLLFGIGWLISLCVHAYLWYKNP